MRRASKVDQNQREIVDALTRCGWRWIDLTRVGGGCPDGVVQRGDVVRLVEVKATKGKLTKAQTEFHRLFSVHILRSVDDAIALR